MSVSQAFIKDENDVLVKLFNVNVPPGVREGYDHRHAKFEIALFKEGNGVYTTKLRTYSIKSGDVFVFSSNENHSITRIDDCCDMRLMNLHVEPRYFWGSKFDSFGYGGIFFSHSPNFLSRLSRNSEYTDKIRNLLLETEAEFENMSPEYELMIRAKITEIFVTLIRNCGYMDEQNKSGGVTDTRPIRRSLDFIHRNLTERLTLADIADYAGMSPSYFSAYFCSVMGIKLWDYITENRIELAMRALESNSGDTMLDIALQSGFNNTANFNKAFRKFTGRTPSEYRAIGKAALY